MHFDYNTVIFLTGLLSIGAVTTLIFNRAWAWLNQGRGLFSWQGFVDNVNAVLQVIGLKRELRKSMEEYIDNLSTVASTLRKFRARYADDSSSTKAAYGRLTVDESREFNRQMLELLKSLDNDLGVVRHSISQITSTLAEQLDIQRQAGAYGVTLTPVESVGQGSAMTLTTPMASTQATGVSSATMNDISVELKSDVEYKVVDAKNQRPDLVMMGDTALDYVRRNGLTIGLDVHVIPNKLLKSQQQQQQSRPIAQNPQQPPRGGSPAF